MPPCNQMSRLVARFKSLPTPLRQGVLTFLLGSRVPFVGTARLKIEEVSHQRVVVSVRNRRRVQNHIQGVHAAAMALLVETASGFAIGMHLPDDKIPLLKTLKVDYLKRTRGGLKAVVEFRPEQVEVILSQKKGEITVPVAVRDHLGKEPIRCEVIWAWIPRKRAGGQLAGRQENSD
jgi:acyl-coenzyme A thioesterase PaaI-like protein